MSSTDPQSQRPRPAWRTGWTWTLIKCAVTTVATALAGTGAMFLLIRLLLDKLPGWLPSTWVRWAFEWLLAHVWFVGPALGALLGLLISAGIVVFDAKRGRLTRLS